MERIPVTIGNRSTKLHATPEQLTRLKSYFAFQPPGYRFMPSYKIGQWDGFIHMLKWGRLPTGVFLDQYRNVHEEGEFGFVLDTDERRKPEFRELPENLKPLVTGDYAYQSDCVNAMVKASGCGGLILSATGTGKTTAAGLYFARLIGKGLFVVDELTLMEQAYQALKAMLGEQEVGKLGEGVFNPRRITVATIQTLSNHANHPALYPIETMMLDEIHTSVNARTEDAVKRINPKAVFGLTATLELNKPHVRLPTVALTGPPVFTFPLAMGVEAGVLSKSVVVLLRRQNETFPGMSTDDAYYPGIVFNAARNQLVANLCVEGRKLGLNTVVLIERVRHLVELSNLLIKANVEHRILSGVCPKAERVEAIQAMENGKLGLILASRIFAKGVNIKSIGLIIDATGFPGKNAAQQRHGRGVRINENKMGLIHIDIQDHGTFGDASRSRADALRALKVEIIESVWTDSAQKVFKQANQFLKKETHMASLSKV